MMLFMLGFLTDLRLENLASTEASAFFHVDVDTTPLGLDRIGSSAKKT